jgi:integrase
MELTRHMFTDRQVLAAKPGRTQVTGTTGLYVHTNPDGSRRWVWRYTKANGRPSEMGLGKYPVVTLSDARAKVLELQRTVARSEDPVQAKRAAKRQKEIDDTRFGDVVQDYAKEFTGKEAIVTMLNRHAAPLMSMPIADVNTPAIARALAPINAKHPLTARQALNLKYAKVHGLRATADDADWKDTFSHIWAPAKAGPHHRALPYTEVPALFAHLATYELATARALQMLILCASRTGEVLGATWEEIDLSARTWTIPASRMKAGREHVVPLSDAALAVLNAARQHDGDWRHVFKGMAKGSLSPRSLERALHVTFAIKDASVHGMRSAFRDWAGDMTDTPREVCEAALAHTIGGVEGAYRRGSALEKRRHLMQMWGRYCLGETAASNVVPFAAAR